MAGTGFIELDASPTTLVFGNVNASTSSPSLSVTLTNNSRLAYEWYVNINPSDSRFVATPSGPLTIYPGADNAVTINFVFNASAVVGAASATYCTQDGATSPFPFYLTAETVGSVSWNITPNIYNFGSLKIGANSSFVFTINNTDTVNSLQIVSVTPNESEFAITGLPALPFTLTPGTSQTFTVTCTAELRGIVNYPTGVTVTATTGEGSVTLQLGYSGFVITPAYTLTGATQGVLFGLGGRWRIPSSVVFSLYNIIAQSLASLPCEAPATLSKMIDFGNASSLTYINRVFMRVDPLGAVTVQMNDTGVVSQTFTTTTDTKSRASLTTDVLGIPDELVFDAEQNSEIHLLQFIVAANGGILSIQNIIPAYEPRGSVYESK